MLLFLSDLSVLCSVLYSDPHAGGRPVQEGSSLLQIQTLHNRALHGKNKSGSSCLLLLLYINLCDYPFRK